MLGGAEIGSENYDSNLMYSGHDAIGIGVQQLSNANALDVDKKAKAVLAELAKSFPPGIKYVVAFDTTTVVGDSVREVVRTLEEAILIVIAVIFLFLLDWRATIIPAITIPVSLVGTFAFIKIFGFSINSLTLFGITLATGLVVDDAIVVIENVQRHINTDKTDPHTATSAAMKEVSGAVVATSLVLISVFVPVSFFPGTTGILYKQFSLTIAFSIAISLFNALTLSPALAAILLRGEEFKYSVFDWTHIGWLKNAYAQICPRSRWRNPRPGFRLCEGHHHNVEVPLRDGCAVLCRTGSHCLHVHPRSHRLRAAGRSELLYRGGTGATRCVALLYHEHLPRGGESPARRSRCLWHLCRPWLLAHRWQFVKLRARVRSAEAHRRPQRQRARGQRHRGSGRAQAVRHTRSRLWSPSSRRPFRASAASVASSSNCRTSAAIRLQDLDEVAHKIVAGSHQRKDLTGLFTSFTANDPQQLVQIDREKAKAMGVPLSQVTQALGVYMGSQYVNDFDFNNRSYRVYVQADQPFRMTASGPAAILRSFRYQRPGAAGEHRFAERHRGTAGDQPLQPVPLRRDRRGCRSRIQFRRRPEGDGRSGPPEHAAGHVVGLVRTGAGRNRGRPAKPSSSSASVLSWSISRSRHSTKASRFPSSSCWLYRWRCWVHCHWSRGVVWLMTFTCKSDW